MRRIDEFDIETVSILTGSIHTLSCETETQIEFQSLTGSIHTRAK